MSYDKRKIITIIDKANKEARDAAQAVYDKYQKDLDGAILAQMRKGDKFFSGMGVAAFENKDGNRVGEDMAEILCKIQYPPQLDGLGFITTDTTK